MIHEIKKLFDTIWNILRYTCKIQNDLLICKINNNYINCIVLNNYKKLWERERKKIFKNKNFVSQIKTMIDLNKIHIVFIVVSEIK